MRNPLRPILRALPFLPEVCLAQSPICVRVGYAIAEGTFAVSVLRVCVTGLQCLAVKRPVGQELCALSQNKCFNAHTDMHGYNSANPHGSSKTAQPEGIPGGQAWTQRRRTLALAAHLHALMRRLAEEVHARYAGLKGEPAGLL